MFILKRVLTFSISFAALFLDVKRHAAYITDS